MISLLIIFYKIHLMIILCSFDAYLMFIWCIKCWEWL